MRVLGAALLAVFLGAVALPGAAQEAVTIPVPSRGGAVSVGLKRGALLIRSVTLKNVPSRRDLRSARHDRDDTTTLRWIFSVSNGGRRDWRARIRVQVLAADDRLLADDSRADDVDARKWKDHISVWTKVRTRDWPRAHHVRVSADLKPD